MATHSNSERTERTGQGGGEVNRMAKRYLTIGILGTTLLLAFLIGVAAKQGGSSTTSVADAPAAVPANVVTGGQYRLSPPNELDPDGAFSGGAAPTSYPPYRVSPPNEQQPSDN